MYHVKLILSTIILKTKLKNEILELSLKDEQINEYITKKYEKDFELYNKLKKEKLWINLNGADGHPGIQQRLVFSLRGQI